MAVIKDPAEILTEFGERIGIPDVEFDEDGYCCLGFDDVVLNLELNEAAGHIIISSEIGKLPSQPTESILFRYLALNHLALMMGTGGIGVDEDRRVVMFVDRVSLRGLDIQIIEAEITRIVDRAEALAAALSSPEFESVTTTRSDSLQLMNFALSRC